MWDHDMEKGEAFVHVFLTSVSLLK